MLVCATFPLIWVGGLVTTTDAGMAVSDWPTTRGYNMFLLPIGEWLGSGWKLFIEHSHRLFGALVGMITLVLAAAIWRWDGRRWMRYLALLAVAAVIFQGVLGGVRVIEDERLLAMVHGCFGPLFFALAVAIAAAMSPWWRKTTGESRLAEGRALSILAWLTALIAYAQLVLGAQVRHIPLAAAPGWFDAAVFFHLLNAGVLLAHVVWLWRRCRRTKLALASAPSTWLLAILAGQIALGGATWVVHFGWPQFLQDRGLGAGYVVQAQSVVQAVVTTAHVALGSLILALSVLVALRASRLAWVASHEPAVQEATEDSRTTARRAAAAPAAPVRAMELAT